MTGLGQALQFSALLLGLEGAFKEILAGSCDDNH